MSLGGYIFAAKSIYETLTPISREVAKIFGKLATMFYDLTAGLESFIQTEYVIVSFYGLLTNAANVSTTQIANIVGYVVRMFLRSLIIEKPGPKPGPDMWLF